MATSTPNIGLLEPSSLSYNSWGVTLNTDLSIIDSIFGGGVPVPALTVTGTITAGTVIAGTFSGLNGAYFLQSSLFGQPNGIAQLNSSGLIPASLISSSGLITVPYASVPSFNGAQASGFNMTLTGNVTGSTFINGTSGASLVAFRITQDAVGGHTFVWPTNCRNAGTVSPSPNARSIQFFMLQSDGSLDAAALIMYS